VRVHTILLAFSALTLCIDSAVAQDSFDIEPGAVTGVGFLECSILIDWHERGIDTQAVGNWVLGFWSGMAGQFEPQRNIADISAKPDALLTMIVGRCYEDPKELIVNAALAVHNTLPIIGGK